MNTNITRAERPISCCMHQYECEEVIKRYFIPTHVLTDTGTPFVCKVSEWLRAFLRSRILRVQHAIGKPTDVWKDVMRRYLPY